jgi:hypothetical protein
MEKNDSTQYLTISDSALLILNFLNINPYSDNNLERMYRRIQRLIHRRQIPFKKVNQRYFLNTKDIELLGVKIKEENKISCSYMDKQEHETESLVHYPVDSQIEKIANIIKLVNNKTISSKQALSMINTIIKHNQNA